MSGTDSRVMFVTNSLTGGGAERSTNVLVNSLTKLNINNCLVTVNDSLPDLVVPICEVFELKRPWQGNFLSIVKALLRLQLQILKWKPDFLVLNCDIPEFLGALTLGKHKLIGVEHATFPWTHRIRLGKVVRKILDFRETTWVAVSDHLTIWPTKHKPDYVISNSLMLSGSTLEKVSGPINRLVFIGRLSKEKQPSWVIQIAHDTNRPALFLGDGLLKNNLQEQAIVTNVDLELAGFVRDPWAKFESGDLLIVPSKFEGDGLVVIEALSRNIPLLLNDIADLRRFGLPEHNYCEGIIEFSNRIEKNKHDLSQFLIPAEFSTRILKNRDASLIAAKWVEVFAKVK